MIDSSLIISGIAAIIAALALWQSGRINSHSQKQAVLDKQIDLRLQFIELTMMFHEEIDRLESSMVQASEEDLEFFRNCKVKIEQLRKEFDSIKSKKLTMTALSKVEVDLYSTQSYFETIFKKF